MNARRERRKNAKIDERGFNVEAFNHKYIISHYAVGFIRSLAMDKTNDE